MTAAVISHLWASTIVLLLAFAIARFAPRLTARTRYAVLLAGLAKFALPSALFAPLASLIGGARSGSVLMMNLVRGPLAAPVTLVEYGDFECPYCGMAEPVVRELLRDFGDIRYVWRHLPLSDVHPRAQVAAEATEVADEQGAFWEMHDLLLDHQDRLTPDDLVGYADELGLDVERFTNRLQDHAGAARVAEDVDSADLSGVSGTPTFFINGRRHYGAYDIDTLTKAVQTARARAAVAA